MPDITFQADVAAAVAAMRRGGVIAYPTDTVWGIGCDASCQEAVRRVYEIKRRADSKALITLVADRDMLERHVGCLSPSALSLIRESDRPLTVVYPEGMGVAGNLLAPDGSIGIRITTEAFSQALCRELGGPVVPTSANFSGEPSPAVFAEIDPSLLGMLDYVAHYRRSDTSRALPSRVCRLEADGTVKILRP